MIIKNIISNTSKYKLINFSLFKNDLNIGTSRVMVDIITPTEKKNETKIHLKIR